MSGMRDIEHRHRRIIPFFFIKYHPVYSGKKQYIPIFRLPVLYFVRTVFIWPPNITGVVEPFGFTVKIDPWSKFIRLTDMFKTIPDFNLPPTGTTTIDVKKSMKKYFSFCFITAQINCLYLYICLM